MRAELWLIAVGVLAACDDGRKESPKTTLGTVRVSPSAPAGGDRSAKPKRAAPEPPRAARLVVPVERCRAVSVDGSIERLGSSAPLHSGASLDDAPALVLDEGASLTIKHARTTRELVVRGPAKVIPCYLGGETFVLGTGVVETVAGAGARPGAEVTIATPAGVLHYGDARLKLELSSEALSVELLAGKAWLEPSGTEGTLALSPGKPLARKSGPPNVKTSLNACDAAARKSQEVGRALLGTTSKGSTLGRKAAEHFEARRNARKKCGIAAATLLRAPEGATLEAAWARLKRADARWQGRSKERQVVE